ncbi:AlbA family DNA-binding domain-containing protein [Afifella aestuarii]|uniref:AlbA family DNA-binding domain-containing protein n=1 Tax=Afifella aestuarii TaxID=1909496 RepID=UPI0013E4011B|nr:ATP-binding protein [Afifella aestuarii]
MPYGPFDKPLDALTSEDIDSVVRDSLPESLFLELKKDLAASEGEKTSRWAQGHTKSVPEGARDKIAREICAFANADGGTLIIGINETAESPGTPGHADEVVPLPEPGKLADQLKRSLGDVIEPPLGRIEAAAVLTTEENHGVVVLRGPPSPLAPHRVKGKVWHCFIRREDESKQMDMRQIQDMVLQREYSAVRLEQQFEREAERFANRLQAQRARSSVGQWLGWHLLVIPETSVALDLTTPYNTRVSPGALYESYRCSEPRKMGQAGELLRIESARPILGGIASSLSSGSGDNTRSLINLDLRWYKNGRFQLGVFYRAVEEEPPAIGRSVFTRLLADCFWWPAEVRARCGDPSIPFIMQTAIDNEPKMMLVERGGPGTVFGQPTIGGTHVSQLHALGAGEAFDDGVTAICEDIFNAFGADANSCRYTYR